MVIFHSYVSLPEGKSHLWSDHRLGDHPSHWKGRQVAPDGVTASIWVDGSFPDSSRFFFFPLVSARFWWPWRFLNSRTHFGEMEVANIGSKRKPMVTRGFPFKNPPFYGFLWAKIRINRARKKSDTRKHG